MNMINSGIGSLVELMNEEEKLNNFKKAMDLIHNLSLYELILITRFVGDCLKEEYYNLNLDEKKKEVKK